MLPVVLMHGIFGFDQVKLGPLKVRYFRGIERAIEQHDHALLVNRVHPTAPIRKRALQARESIHQWLEATGNLRRKIIIVAHSMGGLDARYMVSRLGMDEHVAAIVTIATPHHGSALADFWMENRAMQNVCLPLLDLIGIDGQGGNDLTRCAAKQFNDDVPDVPGVRYFSVSAACPAARVPLVLQPGYWIVYRAEGENDAMVSVDSARWGEHLCTWPVHHMHQVNHRFPIDTISGIGNIAPMYVSVLDEVERRLAGEA